MPTPEYDVFLSRKSEDANLVMGLYEFLVEKGLKVFDSEHSLKEIGDTDYSRSIDNAISNSKHLIVFGSSIENINSPWVEYEWRCFLNIKRNRKYAGNVLTLISSDLKLIDLPVGLQAYQVYFIDKIKFKDLLPYLGYLNKIEKPGESGGMKKNIKNLKKTIDSKNVIPSFNSKKNDIFTRIENFREPIITKSIIQHFLNIRQSFFQNKNYVLSLTSIFLFSIIVIISKTCSIDPNNVIDSKKNEESLFFDNEKYVFKNKSTIGLLAEIDSLKSVNNDIFYLTNLKKKQDNLLSQVFLSDSLIVGYIFLGNSRTSNKTLFESDIFFEGNKNPVTGILQIKKYKKYIYNSDLVRTIRKDIKVDSHKSNIIAYLPINKSFVIIDSIIATRTEKDIKYWTKILYPKKGTTLENYLCDINTEDIKKVIDSSNLVKFKNDKYYAAILTYSKLDYANQQIRHLNKYGFKCEVLKVYDYKQIEKFILTFGQGFSNKIELQAYLSKYSYIADISKLKTYKYTK